MKKFFISLIISLFFATYIFSLPKPQKIKRLLEYAATQIKDISGTADITTITYGKPHTKKIKYFAKQPNKMYVEYTSPKEMKGAKIICDGKTIWRYYPSMKKCYSMDLKGPASKKGKTMDKELGMITNLVATDIKDFWEKNELVVLGEDKIKGRKTYVIELKPKEQISNIKSQQKLWIEQNSGLTLKIEFTFLDVKETIVFNYEKFNSNLPDKLFVYKDK